MLMEVTFILQKWGRRPVSPLGPGQPPATRDAPLYPLPAFMSPGQGLVHRAQTGVSPHLVAPAPLCQSHQPLGWAWTGWGRAGRRQPRGWVGAAQGRAQSPARGTGSGESNDESHLEAGRPQLRGDCTSGGVEDGRVQRSGGPDLFWEEGPGSGGTWVQEPAHGGSNSEGR